MFELSVELAFVSLCLVELGSVKLSSVELGRTWFLFGLIKTHISLVGCCERLPDLKNQF